MYGKNFIFKSFPDISITLQPLLPLLYKIYLCDCNFQSTVLFFFHHAYYFNESLALMCVTNVRLQRNTVVTFWFAYGMSMPRVNTANIGPPIIPKIVIDACSSGPTKCAQNAKAIDRIP